GALGGCTARPPRTPPLPYTTPFRSVEQGLFNALDNALKASRPDGEVLLQVERNGSEMRMLVCDRGPGLPASEWERVFNPFYTFRSEEHTSELQSREKLVCRLLLEQK